MQTVVSVDGLRSRVAAWRRAGARVGFVPTMGNLHEGHFSLIGAARARSDRVVASVFVNPTQFGPAEDFSTYPRTLAQDQAGLAASGCDLLFAPAIDEMYPFGAERTVRVEVPELGAILDGAARPGHFVGVATVVTKLLNLVQPDVAVFGQKDYQQLLVIRRLVQDLRLPVEIIGAPTKREANGLAMSSRNQYLAGNLRSRATVLWQAIRMTRRAVASSSRPVPARRLKARVRRIVADTPGARLDYVEYFDPETLAPALRVGRGTHMALAVRVGRTRLIDNARL